ncbi:hypothetical protein HO133_001539 [Letharia lupina]|uniref:Uncharacterized protein n=1 Tax=Letharia lupina TaxID=560253 RepID=A0A8H6FC56_9LECA|nr:uncharacterized protein HO133_001539 [Letharia lupina]KAF6222453.1 hypothetical protein HO133_001539 [Letharia lupina]
MSLKETKPNIDGTMLLRSLYLLTLFACTLATAPHPLHVRETNPDPSSPTPTVLAPRFPPNWISTQSTGQHATSVRYAVTFWKATAILPVVAAAQPMADFYRKATLAAVQAIRAQSITNSYTFGLGVLNLYVDTLDRSPIDMEMLIQFVVNMVGVTNRGWTNHYAALVKDQVTGALTLISLEAAGGVAMAWLGSATSVEQYGNDPFGS